MGPSILNCFRLLADPLRARIILLLTNEELTVAELQQILNSGQSRISMSLGQLKRAGLVEDRRDGKHSLYRIHPDLPANRELAGLLEQSSREIPERAADESALELVLRKRKDRMRSYFDELAGKFGRDYVPGRSWKALAEALLKLLPPMVVADLGAGEGTLAQLLAQRAEKVIAVDNSEKMVAFGRELAERHGLANLDYRMGDLESLPIDTGSVDLAIFSQSLHHAPHPQQAVNEARRILRPTGRIVILDLLRHNFEEAREMYADLWLGFPEVELEGLLKNAGFVDIESSIVYKEDQAPHLKTLLVVGRISLKG
ncbi:MAG: metalloregulator ArsR/SmtB family transcription factor [Candidatus Solibacter usitatus]|nr:metalloregulator ArsR/SmtB family transcription factor [Candidatus Solibacter usitatus]